MPLAQRGRRVVPVPYAVPEERMRAKGAPVRPAETHYDVERAVGARYTLLRVRIVTGVMHLIRAHLAHLGHPWRATSPTAGRPRRSPDCPVVVGYASDLTVQDLAGLGVRRVSVGGTLARAAWGGFMRAARLLSEQGRFDGLSDAAPGAELNALFRAPF